MRVPGIRLPQSCVRLPVEAFHADPRVGPRRHRSVRCRHRAADHLRHLVTMPDMMQEDMRANMRDHLLAISEIQSGRATSHYDQAGGTAEQRLGMTSLEADGSRHMAGMMAEGMQTIGTALHHAASRFAITAQEVSVSGDLHRALSALAEVTQQCVACHAGLRLANVP
jgi:hypothetical protein